MDFMANLVTHQNKDLVHWQLTQVQGNDKATARKLLEGPLTTHFGTQKIALQVILAEATNSSCYLLQGQKRPLGIAIQALSLTDKYSKDGYPNSLEIKAFIIINPKKNSRQGGGSFLLKKILDQAKMLNAKTKSVHIHVSERYPALMDWLQKKGFQAIKTVPEPYADSLYKCWLFCYPLDKIKAYEEPKKVVSTDDLPEMLKGINLQDTSEKKVEKKEEKASAHQWRPTTKQPSSMATSRKPEQEKKEEQKDVKRGEVKNVFLQRAYSVKAHWDDIHTLNLLSDGTFVSGSKDGTLCKWTSDGNLHSIVMKKSRINYEQWITAATVVDRDRWLCGTRNGEVILWTTKGKKVGNLTVIPPSTQHKSKTRNLQRVNCLAIGKNSDEKNYFVGWGTQFTEHSIESDSQLSFCNTSKNDWVYCIHALTESRLLVVTGEVLQIWNKMNNRWRCDLTLVDRSQEKFDQRPYISSLTQLEGHPSHFGIAVFDGSVKVMDIEKNKTVNHWQEHIDPQIKSKRVWMIENITRDIFASCGDDHLIKLWDVRQAKSVATYRGHVGRVSTILRISDQVLVAGTCPDYIRQNIDWAELVFYDIRK